MMIECEAQSFHVHVWFYRMDYPVPEERDLDVSVEPSVRGLYGRLYVHVEDVVNAAVKELAKQVSDECKSKRQFLEAARYFRVGCVAVYAERGGEQHRRIIWNMMPLSLDVGWKKTELPKPIWWWNTSSDEKLEAEMWERIRKAAVKEDLFFEREFFGDLD